MARALRIEYEGALYHITARGNRRDRIFAGDQDRQDFIDLLTVSLARYAVELHAYVLLTNHFHLIARTSRANLARWMHWLLVAYTVRFNRRHSAVGHLFQGRYKSLLVEPGSYLLELSRYLHLNPVRGSRLGAGTPQERRERLRAYSWSSYRGYAGVARQASFVTEDLVFGEFQARTGQATRVQYRRFVEEGLLREIENPAEAAQWQAVLGSEEFLHTIKDRMQARREGRREVKALRKATAGPSPGAVVAVVAKKYGVPAVRLLQGRAYGLRARSVAMWAVWQLCGLTLREIGELFGGMDYAAVAQRIRRLELDRQRRKELHDVLIQCQNI